MIVGGEELFERSLLKNSDESNFKNASYYLTIGEIVPVGDPDNGNFVLGHGPEAFTLKPKEMVWVTSNEEFSFDAYDMFGLATLRTTLTKSGLLALNTGVIDPSFSGPIGTAIINFSSRPVPLKKGDQFMRVVFFKHDVVPDRFRQSPITHSRQSYLNDVQRDAIALFPRNFLDAKELSEEFYAELERKMTGYFLKKYWWAIILAGLLVLPGLIDGGRSLLLGSSSESQQEQPSEPDESNEAKADEGG